LAPSAGAPMRRTSWNTMDIDLVVWGEIKEGKLPVSRRYNLLPLLPSGPDGVRRELAVRDLPLAEKTRALGQGSRVPRRTRLNIILKLNPCEKASSPGGRY